MAVKNQNDHGFNPKVVVASVSFSKSAVLREGLLSIFPNSIFNETGQELSDGELIKFFNNADAAIVGVETINETLLEQTPALKVISKYGVGLDGINQDSLKRRNISLGWTGGVNRQSVSELTLCFMLGLCRNVFTSGFKLKNSKWEKKGGHQLSGKIVGIIGCGYIGSEVIRLLSPFKCPILVNDILDKSDFCRNHQAKIATLDEVMSQSDIITLHVPLTELTNSMVDETFFKGMKQTAFLINTSRGKVVNQDALKTALKQGDIRGAALDVFTEEPPTDGELLYLPNLMATPHIGGNTREAVNAMGKSAISHLVSFFEKHPK